MNLNLFVGIFLFICGITGTIAMYIADDIKFLSLFLVLAFMGAVTILMDSKYREWGEMRK